MARRMTEVFETFACIDRLIARVLAYAERSKGLAADDLEGTIRARLTSRQLVLLDERPKVAARWKKERLH